jgi:hypothetical protein
MIFRIHYTINNLTDYFDIIMGSSIDKIRKEVQKEIDKRNLNEKNEMWSELIEE